MTDATDSEERLAKVLRANSPLAVAVSGGVDSMTLAYLAHRLVNAEIVHATSPAVPAEATARVEKYARSEGWALNIVLADEFDDPGYIANPVNRCYFCKTNLYDRIARLSGSRIASGANLDDLNDYRPGLVAAAQRRVLHPFIEANIDKAGVRSLARAYRLDDLAELPAQPCLSSRIETGIAITADDLAFVHRIETALRPLVGETAELRCRVTRLGIVIELADDCPEEAREAADGITRQLTAASGRTFAGARAYRRGSMFVHKPSAFSGK